MLMFTFKDNDSMMVKIQFYHATQKCIFNKILLVTEPRAADLLAKLTQSKRPNG